MMPLPLKQLFQRARTLKLDERLRFTLLLCLIALVLNQMPAIQRLDYLTYDMLLRLPAPERASQSVIIAIDEHSLEALGRWPWPREYHAQLLGHLEEAASGPVALDILFSESAGLSDTLMAEAMKRHGRVWMPLHLQQSGSEFRPILPTPTLLAAAKGLGHVHLPLDEDGIVRQIRLYEGDPGSPWPALPMALALENHPTALSTYVAHFKDRLAGIPFRGQARHIPRFSYVDVLNGTVPAELLAGKTIFVGATAAGLGDFLTTPFSGKSSPMAGVEVHATVYDGLVHQQLTETLPTSNTLVLTLCAILMAAILFPRVPPQFNWPLSLLLMLGVFGVSCLLLFTRSTWLPPGTSLLTMILAYPVWSWRRFNSLNRFLNEEIYRLSNEPGLKTLIPNDTVKQWGQQLVLMLKPDAWAFKPGVPYAESRGHAHFDELGRFQFVCPLPGMGQMQLEMEFEATRPDLDRICQYLNRLELPLAKEGLPRGKRVQLVERRIRQVHYAIRSLQDMRRFVSETLERMPDGILITDELGRLFYANESAKRWLDNTLDQGTPLGLLLDERQQHPDGDAQWSHLIRGAAIHGSSATRTWIQGEHAWRILIAPLQLSHKGNSGVIVSLSDISAEHAAQQERLETINFISHDLRSPLSSQLAILERARREAVTPDNIKAVIATLHTLTRRSLLLADEFLQLARVEAQTELNLYPCAIADIIDNTLDTVSAQAATMQVSLELNEVDTDLYVLGNADLLDRALGNLVGNAIKFSPAQSQVTLTTRRVGTWIRLEVEDHGPGIAAQEIPRLFTSFQRTQSSEQTRKPGSGLGLKFVKTVVERHGGTVGVESREGHGSRFWFELPEHREN
ncbi:MAG: CHASE2 domain-containing protein [Hahellaceae bacterium]|nr:CHASE2 domain-containing protein [Hahellaceae bacterium]